MDINIYNISNGNRFLYSDVYFYLFTRRNQHDPEEIKIDEQDSPKIRSIFLDASKDTKIITHGWLSNGTSSSVMDIINAYLRKSDYNLIAVDWADIASNIFYPFAAVSTPWVGARIAYLIDTLIDTYSISGRQIHLIGHSLGAHVMGNAGIFTKENLSRITGLDPARPIFEFPPNAFGNRFSLDEEDSDFVDIIHTCAGVLGYLNNHGHVDFYPNSGYPAQPGCSGIKSILDACSHSRAYQYFAESVLNEKPKFIAWSAESWDDFKQRHYKETGTMGEHVNYSSRGQYYLYTNSDSTFAKGSCSK